MPGEGLGGRLDPDEWSERYGNDEGHDVVALGEFIIDHIVPVDEGLYEEEGWEGEAWFPEPGASEEVDDVPETVREYAEDVLPGGRSPNQAVAASKAGADAVFLGKVGEQEYALDELDDHVETVMEQEEGRTTGQCYVFLEDDGDNRISCVKDGDGLLDEDYIDRFEDEIMEAEYLLASGGMPRGPLEHVLAMLEGEEEGPSVILDPAPVDGVEGLLGYGSIDAVTPNETEYAALEDEIEDADYDVIRTAAEGAYLDGELVTESPEVDVEDTTGAGDTFNGYLAAGLSDGMAMEEAMEYAVNAASLSVTEQGAMPSIPEADEVEGLLEA